jgi:hypothetical protein
MDSDQFSWKWASGLFLASLGGARYLLAMTPPEFGLARFVLSLSAFVLLAKQNGTGYFV